MRGEDVGLRAPDDWQQSARDAARRRRKRLLDLLTWVFAAVALGYLSLHAVVTFKAYTAAGVLAALATLVTLGFGDLWWAVDAWRSGDRAMLAVAGSAATVAFASWASRGYTNRLLLRLAVADLDDLGREIDQVKSSLDKTGFDREGRR